MIGTCNDMCPDTEIRLRERENLLHPFEVASDHTSHRPKADRHKCVKEYRRPTVGSHDTNRAEIRPPEVLTSTVDYLMNRVVTLNVKWADIYDYVFDRLRSVRQDLVMQECTDKHAIAVLERAVRFHIYSDYRLCMEHISVFDPKINNQHTQECLKRLINMYKTGQNQCPARTEFEATYMLFNLGEEDALRHYLSLDDHIRKALYTMNTGYSSKNLKFPIAKLTTILQTNTDTETQYMCEKYGLHMLGEHVQFLKGNFKNEEKMERCQTDFINERLKKTSIPEILHGDTGNVLNRDFAEKCSTG